MKYINSLQFTMCVSLMFEHFDFQFTIDTCKYYF